MTCACSSNQKCEVKNFELQGVIVVFREKVPYYNILDNLERPFVTGTDLATAGPQFGSSCTIEK